MSGRLKQKEKGRVERGRERSEGGRETKMATEEKEIER